MGKRLRGRAKLKKRSLGWGAGIFSYNPRSYGPQPGPEGWSGRMIRRWFNRFGASKTGNMRADQ